MGIQIVTIKTCDRCGERIHALSREHPEAGELNVAWRGDQSAIAYDGAAGGASVEGKGLLCMRCLRAFLAFMQGQRVGDERERQGLK
jgi:hypothetical protein